MKKITYFLFFLLSVTCNFASAQSKQIQDLKQAKEDLNYCTSVCNLRYNTQSTNDPLVGRNNLNCTNECMISYKNKNSCITSQLNSYYDSKRCESGSYYDAPLPKEIDISGLILKFLYLILIVVIFMYVAQIFFPRLFPWFRVVDGVVKLKLETDSRFSNILNAVEFKFRYLFVLVVPIFILTILNVDEFSGPDVSEVIIFAIIFLASLLAALFLHSFFAFKILSKISSSTSNIFIAFLIGTSGYALGFLMAHTLNVTFSLSGSLPFLVFVLIIGLFGCFSNIIQIQYHSKLITDIPFRELLIGLLIWPFLLVILSDHDNIGLIFFFEASISILSIILARSYFGLRIFTFFDSAFRLGELGRKYLDIFKNKFNI